MFVPRINLSSNEIIFEQGADAYQNQDYELAVFIFNQIISKYPGYGDAYYYIGLSYFAEGEYYQSSGRSIPSNVEYFVLE